MNRIEVKSSFIESIGYEDGWMEVEYKNGKVYNYIGIPPDLYKSVIGAESIGKAFREQILKGGFEGERLELESGEIE